MQVEWGRPWKGVYLEIEVQWGATKFSGGTDVLPLWLLVICHSSVFRNYSVPKKGLLAPPRSTRSRDKANKYQTHDIFLFWMGNNQEPLLGTRWSSCKLKIQCESVEVKLLPLWFIFPGMGRTVGMDGRMFYKDTSSQVSYLHVEQLSTLSLRQNHLRAY